MNITCPNHKIKFTVPDGCPECTAVEKCDCAYCKEGMSKSAEECVDRMAEDSKRLREG